MANGIDPGFFANLGGLLSGEHQMSPLFNLGTGLLAASGPSEVPVSFGQRLASGLQFAGGAQSAALDNQLIRERLLRSQRQRQATQDFRNLLDTLGPTSTAIPGEAQAAGVAAVPGGASAAGAMATAPGALTDAQRRALGVLAGVDLGSAAGGLLGMLTPPQPEKPTNLEREFRFLTGIGVPRDQALEALKKGTTVNVGGKLDEPLSATDLTKIRLPDGSTPPIGTTPRQAASAGAVALSDAQRKSIDSADKFGPVLDRLETLALGPGGVFTGIEPGIKNRFKSGINLFVSSLTREQPNVAEFGSLATGTVAPIIRQLGEAGALSDGDVNRALGLLPQIQGDFLLPDTREDARRKLDTLRSIIERGEQKLRGNLGPAARTGEPSGTRRFRFDPATGSLTPR